MIAEYCFNHADVRWASSGLYWWDHSKRPCTNVARTSVGPNWTDVHVSQKNTSEVRPPDVERGTWTFGCKTDILRISVVQWVYYDAWLLWFASIQRHVTIKSSRIHFFYICTSLLPLYLFQKTLSQAPPILFTRHSLFVMWQRVVRESGWGVDTCFYIFGIFCIDKLLLPLWVVYWYSQHCNLCI